MVGVITKSHIKIKKDDNAKKRTPTKGGYAFLISLTDFPVINYLVILPFYQVQSS